MLNLLMIYNFIIIIIIIIIIIKYNHKIFTHI